MSKEWLMILVFFVCVLGSMLYRKWVIARTLRRLFQLRKEHQEEAYGKALQGLDVRLYFPAFTRGLLLMNYYVETRQCDRVIQEYHKLKNIKTGKDNRIAMYTTLYGFFIEEKQMDYARECSEQLHLLLDGKRTAAQDGILQEVEQLDAVYLHKDILMIPVFEEMIAQCQKEEIRSVLLYRLAVLYAYAKRTEDARAALIKAQDSTKHTVQKQKLNYLMHHMEELIPV